ALVQDGCGARERPAASSRGAPVERHGRAGESIARAPRGAGAAGGGRRIGGREVTDAGASEIIALVMGVSPYPWPADGSKQKAWLRVLASPATSDIRDDVAGAPVSLMVTEYAPDKLAPAQIVAVCRSYQVHPLTFRALPPPYV